MDLQFEYKTHDEEIDKDKFFQLEGNEPFDTESAVQMMYMMEDVCLKLNIKDEYLIKKLEMMLKYELPFFATNRRLARNWIVENFVF